MDTSKSGKLEELRKIVAAATPGPWKWNTHPHDRYLLSKAPGISEDDDLILGGAFDALGIKKPNARFIATFSPSLVARLLDVVEAVKEDVDLAEQWDAVMDGDLDTQDFNREIGRIHDARTKAVKRILESLRALEGSDDA